MRGMVTHDEQTYRQAADICTSDRWQKTIKGNNLNSFPCPSLFLLCFLLFRPLSVCLQFEACIWYMRARVCVCCLGLPSMLFQSMLLSTFVLILCMVIGTAVAFCNSPIYCEGPILKRIQLARLFPDSKTFVDMVKKRNHGY